MNYLLLLLSAILIVGISTPVYGQTISEHIVINEIDTNPPGDDSKLISEWVELYNPTDNDVDISGWEIASTTVLKKTLVIPDGTIIDSGNFLTFVNDKIWFTDTAELVELKNENGIIVDTTREIFDLENNLKSWQRIYDGSAEWKFTFATAGGSNGKLVESETSEKIEVSVSFDKSEYVFDETVIIQGTVSEKIFTEKPYFQAEPIMINISGPNFVQTLSLYPDYNLNYETTLKLSKVLGINEGNYDVAVTYGNSIDRSNFSITSKLNEVTIQNDSNLTVLTDKFEYLPGELVTISGTIDDVIPFTSLVFSINNSVGQLVTSGNLFPSNGEFTTNTYLTTVNPNYGAYTISVEYDKLSATHTFNVVKQVDDISVDVLSDSILFDIDKSEYVVNDYMTLSGQITNFDPDSDIYYQVVYLNFKASNGVPPFMTSAIKDSSGGAKSIEFSLTAIPDKSGMFSIESRIPPVAFLEGEYTVKANYGGLIAVEKFSIVDENSSINENFSTNENSAIGNPNSSIPGKSFSNEQKDAGGYVVSNEQKDADENIVSNVKTIIEKVNRIADNLISINTSEKIIDENSVKPRVLSGSMVTTSKDSQPTVNLQVTSESGICIIGQNDNCLVSESTRKPGQIFEVVQVDGLTLNVRYSGPDVRLEKFSLSPESSEAFLPDTNWNVEVIKDNEISRFYYKVTYKTLQ
tara:strand:- start:976 stop:3054 length:2079 start_codon:yes stop_codon:yes gene_type:complete